MAAEAAAYRAEAEQHEGAGAGEGDQPKMRRQTSEELEI